MAAEKAFESPKTVAHEHTHAQNRFAAIPTPLRLDADESLTGRGVTIAFLDSGFHPHPDLVEPTNRIIAYHDLTGEEPVLDSGRNSEAWHWHGTMTSVAACGNGQLSDGIYRGLASEANLVLVKASSRGRIIEEAIARGIEWVVENRERLQIRVLNISLGGDEDVPYESSAIDRAAEEAVRAGIVVVAAAGNSGCSERHTSVPPANSPSVITVGGHDDMNSFETHDDGAYCSNYGLTADGLMKPEIIAPAMWVAAPILPGTASYEMAEKLSRLVSAPDYALARTARELWDGDAPPELLAGRPEEIRAAVERLLRENRVVATHYQHADGTSFAAPVVSSLVAQMLEANPRLTPSAVKHILVSTAARARGVGAERQGYGVLHARRAVEAARREEHVFEIGHFGPPRVWEGGTVFFHHDDAARRVELAGDFNDWNPKATPFARGADGVWRAVVAELKPGRYRYKFLIDGVRWAEDTASGLKEPDGFGGFNSILDVP